MRQNSITGVFRKALILYIILPVFLLETLLFLFLAGNQIRGIRDKVFSVQRQIVSNMEKELREAKLLLATIAHNDYLIRTVSYYADETDREKKLKLLYEIEGNLDNLFNYHDRIDSIAFYYKGEGVLFFNTPLAEPEENRRSGWYRRALEEEGRIVIIEDLSPLSRQRSSIPRINLVIAPPDRSSYTNVEAIVLSVNFESLNSLPDDSSEESYAVLGSRGTVLYPRTGRYEPVKNRGVNRYPIRQSPWVFETSFSYRDRIFSGLKVFILIFAAIILCILLFFIVFSRRLAVSILEPIVNLSTRMGELGLWHQTAAPEMTEAYQVEIRQIYDSFDRMSRRLVDLNRETLRLELEALQFQINPHFLINTLNSIKILAQVHGNEEVVRMTRELMEIVGALLHRTGMLTSLDKELECVAGYIHIQKIRFGDLFDYSVQISEELKGLTIPKMILQPIIENAIQHGFRKAEGRGHLEIAASREEDDLVIRIRDDSRQADLEEIRGILQSALENTITEETDEHKGLRNIQRRIFLRYGPPCGVYASIEEGQTTFTLRLPAEEHREEEE